MTRTMIGVDVGGTFTDIVKVTDGAVVVTKVPTDLASSDRSVLRGAEDVGADVDVFNLASTAGLNAVITRRIPKVAFLTTTGHRDMLARGRLGRPWTALNDPSWRREFGDARRPLVPRYLRRGVDERISGRGEVLIPLDEDQAREELEVLARSEVEGVAICLLNAYIDGRHERRLRELVRDVLGSVACSVSSEVSPLAKEYPRAVTTVVDTVMKVKYGTYTERLSKGLAELGFGGTFNYADCAGRLLPSDYAMERPYRLVVGGPAAGTAASAHLGQVLGESTLLCADVGGTSCDISLVLDGEPWLSSTFELEHDLHVTALSTDVITLGAGGGSVVGISSSGEVQVGPDSAGAEPGPACYGQGGERPTLTDAALLIGILDGTRFLGGKVLLDPTLAESAFAALDSPLPVTSRIDYAWRMGVHNVAEGLLNVTVRHGLDPRDMTVMAFGAAGGMLLPSLLTVLPLRRVVVPPNPGLFSALGMLSSDQVFTDHQTAYTVLDEKAASTVDQVFSTLEGGLLARTGVERADVTLRRTFDGRYVGQSWETPFVEVAAGEVTADAVEAMAEAFHRTYHLRTGTAFRSIAVEVVTLRVEMVVPTPKVDHPRLSEASGDPVSSEEIELRHLTGHSGGAQAYERRELRAGHRVHGPAVVREELSTTFVPAGCVLEVGAHGELSISVDDRENR